MAFTIDSKTHISPNHSSRTNPTPTAIVLHSSEGTRYSDLPWLKKVQGEKSVSCHYYVCKDGTIYQLVPDWREAWHAGISEYLGYTGWGDFSIGIECEHKSGDGWPEIQRQALAWLCKKMIDQYHIKKSMIVAHRWIAPKRKVDPTNWSDAGLIAWIEELYVEDWETRWGTAVPYHETFGIPTRWRETYSQGKPLGKAVSDELQVEGAIVQCFETGFILWGPDSGAVVREWQL